MPASKTNEWRHSPYTPENVHRLARLHVLALFAETGYDLRFDESGNEWDVVLNDIPRLDGLSCQSTLLQHPLGDIIKKLENYMDERYINYPLPGEVEILEEGFWKSPESEHSRQRPVPDLDAKPWLGQEAFLKALFKIEQTLMNEYQIQDYRFPPVIESRGVQTCRICGDSSMHDFVFSFKGWKWPYNLKHYVEAHNQKPSDAFIHFIRKLDGKQLIKTDLAVVNKEGR